MKKRLQTLNLRSLDCRTSIGVKMRSGYSSPRNSSTWPFLFRLGRSFEALTDFKESEAADAASWRGFGGPVYEAECHLYLGNAAAAQASCARLSETYWSPGLDDIAEGTKAEVTADIARRAASL